MIVDIQKLVQRIKESSNGISDHYAENYAEKLIENLDERLLKNLEEWMNGEEISDIWIGKYCINAIMSIRGNIDFLSALEAMNTYLSDEQAGIRLIWRGKK